VPLDHADPDGDRLAVAVVRIRSSEQTERIGSLVLNPGGPGQPGLAYAASWAGWLSDDVLRRFDVVTFDPRGIGASGAIDCGAYDEATSPDDLVTDAGYAAAAALARQGTERCARGLGRRASSYGTRDVARDLDLLRAALGDRRLTYAGFSYGARLGGEYARQFPGRVRALVLDAPPDPEAGWIEVQSQRFAAFEEQLDAWAADCPARASCAPIGADPRGFVSELAARAHATPIVSRRPAPDPAANAAHVVLGAQVLLYSRELWPQLDAALLEAWHGDAGSLFEAIDNGLGRVAGSDEPDPTDAGFVVTCTDRAAGPSEAEVRGAARRLASELPVFGRWRGEELFGCAFWTGGRHPVPLPRSAAADRVLVVGTVGDPATPYAGAHRFAAAVGDARLLTYEGVGHTAYGRSPCIGGFVDAFLLRQARPPAGTRCPA
jgi:pimeloyl-ACP methyl ester carboxylesterase